MTRVERHEEQPAVSVDIDLALRGAVTAAMNTIGHRLGFWHLHWSVRDQDSRTPGVLSGFPSLDDHGRAGPLVAQRWAVVFGLTEQPDKASYRCWTGVLDRYRIDVWCQLPPRDSSSGGA